MSITKTVGSRIFIFRELLIFMALIAYNQYTQKRHVTTIEPMRSQ